MLDLAEPYAALIRGLILASVAVLWTIFLVRTIGLRAFSKMTAFDFVATIATGSLIAQAATRADVSEFVQAMAAIAGVFLIQWLLAKARLQSDSFQNLIQNKPVLLMENGDFLEKAMQESRVSRSNILEKLRSANISDPSKVRAVVLETTGDISVMNGEHVDERLLEGVQRI